MHFHQSASTVPGFNSLYCTQAPPPTSLIAEYCLQVVTRDLSAIHLLLSNATHHLMWTVLLLLLGVRAVIAARQCTHEVRFGSSSTIKNITSLQENFTCTVDGGATACPTEAPTSRRLASVTELAASIDVRPVAYGGSLQPKHVPLRLNETYELHVQVTFRPPHDEGNEHQLSPSLNTFIIQTLCATCVASKFTC